MGSATDVTPRIAPGGRRDVGIVTWLLTRVFGLASGIEPPKLFLILGRNRRLLRGWLSFARRLMPGGKLPRRETEMVILRVSHLKDCAYEHEHHVRLGRRAGLTKEDLARIEEGPAAEGWDPRDRTLLQAVDELHHGDLSDETWAALRSHLNERDCLELLMLAGHYEMLATVINALRIPPDERRRRRK